MKSSAVSAGQNALATQYNNLRSDAKGGSFLLPHEQTSPDLTLYVEPGVCYVGITRVDFAGGNSPTIAAPAANPRIDLLTIDAAGTLALTAGSEAASPSVPTYPQNKVVIAEIYCRVGQTTIRDTDTTGQGYILRDVRPFLGGSYIADDSQVASTAAISVSKININGHVLPDSNNARDLGSSSFQYRAIYGVTIYANGTAVGGKFGGTGADGALSITSGTTTLSAGSARLLVKNYTSISITSTGQLAFSNPATYGTTIMLKSQGNVTVTASGTLIDASAMGGAGGAKSNATGQANSFGGAGGGGAGSSSSGSGGGGGQKGNGTPRATDGSPGVWAFINWHGQAGYNPTDQSTMWYPASSASTNGGGGPTGNYSVLAGQVMKTFGAPGGGGGGGAGGQSHAGGDGGRGGANLYIECGGAYNFTTGTISAAGAVGSNSAGGTGSGGGGGGGGNIAVCYATLTANSGSYSVAGASGGTGSTSGGTGGNGEATQWANSDFT